MTLRPAIYAPLAAAIALGSLADGGASPESLGVGAAVVWLLLAGLLIGGRLEPLDTTTALFGAASLLALLAGWVAISVGWADDDGAAFVEVVRALLLLGAFLLVGLAAREGSGPSWLAGIALGGSAVALLALGARLAGLETDRELALELPAAAERLSFPLGYWNALGYLMAMTLPALAWLGVNGRSAVARAAAAASTPVVVALFLTSSRGAAVAAALALLIVAWSARSPARLARLGLAVVPAWGVSVVAAAVLRSDLDPVSGPGPGAAALAAIMIAAVLVGDLLARRALAGAPGSRMPPPRRLAAALAAGLAAAVAIGFAVGPDPFLGEFRTERAAGTVDTPAGALVSGSGRSSYWSAAIDAFSAEPLRGIGAGGYEDYWNANGGSSARVRNAHSAPLETLATLGAIGFVLLAGFAFSVLVALRSRRRATRVGERGLLGAFAAVIAAGFVAVSVDWTWQTTAAAIPLLVALAVVCGPALRPGGDGLEPLAARGDAPGTRSRRASSTRPLGWAGLATITVVAVWAGSVLALSAVELERGRERFAVGDLAGAANAARSAARIQPWSHEPSLLLAEIERSAANLEAARRRAERAARLAPGDFRPWLILFGIESEVGNDRAALANGIRAQRLGGRVLEGAPSRR